MLVVKRNGVHEPVSKKKIQRFLTHLGEGKIPHLVDTIMKGMPSEISSSELNTYFANTVQAAGYGLLAGRIEMVQLQKSTSPSFTTAMSQLPLDPLFLSRIQSINLDDEIIHENDFTYDLFALRTLKRSYLMKDKDDNIRERPQYMLMRVAATLYRTKEEIVHCYKALSAKEYTHATPTLFNSGMPRGQFASCFLGVMQDDSILGIFNTVKQCALISKTAGGIGLSISNIRATGSHIQGAMGASNGIVPMLRVFNETARYVDQGRRRKGSFAMYLEPWHPDIEAFLDLRKNHGDENTKARDLFTALWVPDLFMERVRDNKEWSLFCPQTINLQDYHSEEFASKYEEAEKTLPCRKIQARDLWEKILRSQIETGTPYIMFKDRVNSCSNQQHLGTIKGSNLCAEVTEYTSPDEIAVCTLASMALPAFVDTSFNFEKFGERVEDVVRHLDRVIDTTYYPLPETINSNFKHRPMGIGVQGLSDVFQMHMLPYDSQEAMDLDAAIFETMYYHALKASMQLAKEKGPYESFQGSPASKGILQFDFYGVTPTRHDWPSLKKDIQKHGLRNSLLIALMPTASTAQILGNSEGTDPRTSNLYTRRVLSGEFMVENHVLRSKVKNWPEVKKVMMRDYGSVQKAPVSQEVKNVFKNVWEISQKYVIQHAARRQPFVCQSQSMNLHLAEPTINKVNAMLFYSWKAKLKTGMYYLRSRPKVNPVQVNEVDEDVCMSCSA
jgi:ribonucleoside-diphosphate reductase alpha subunit